MWMIVHKYKLCLNTNYKRNNKLTKQKNIKKGFGWWRYFTDGQTYERGQTYRDSAMNAFKVSNDIYYSTDYL